MTRIYRAGVGRAPQADYKWLLFPAGEFSNHAKAWRSVLAHKAHSPLLQPAFVREALRVFGGRDEILAICGDPNDPYAMGILRRIRCGIWETFQPSQAPLSPWVFRPDASYEDIMPSLFKALPGSPVMVGITQTDPDIHTLPQNSTNMRVLDYIQTARILLNRPFDEYWRTRDKKLKYEIGRRLKRLCESGRETRLEVVGDSSLVAKAIEDYGNLEVAGWKGKAGTAVTSDNQQGEFYRSVLREFCAHGRGRIYRYYIGDHIAAMQLCIEDADSLVFLKTAFDENYRRYGPGILMKRLIFEHVFQEETLKRIEFYGSFIKWQEKWSDELRTLYHVNCYRWPWLAQLRDVLPRPGTALRHRHIPVAARFSHF